MIHSIAVAYRGKLVLDEYFYDHARDETHDVRSAGKMLSSVILGTLMRDGADISPATKVYDVMAPRGPFANPDPRKKDITLGHLLTHSSGLACDDVSGTSPGDEVKVQSDRTHPDWARVTLDLPMISRIVVVPAKDHAVIIDPYIVAVVGIYAEQVGVFFYLVLQTFFGGLDL